MEKNNQNKPTGWLSLLGNERGAVLPIVGLIFGVLIIATGFAIDYTRTQMVRDRMQMAIDAAALAGARKAVAGEAAVEETAMRYYRANFPPGTMGIAAPPPLVLNIAPGANGTFTLNFSMAHDVPVQSILWNAWPGLEDLRIGGVEAEVHTQPLSPLDVVFSVDVSGSMAWRDGTGSTCRVPADAPNGSFCSCGGPTFSGCLGGPSRIDGAKSQMHTLYGQLNYPGNRFSVVPWSHVVRLPSGANNFASGPNQNSGNAAHGSALGDHSNRPSDHSDPDYASLSDGGNILTYLPPKIKPLNTGSFAATVNGLHPAGGTDPAGGMYWARQQFNAGSQHRAIIFMADGYASLAYDQPRKFVLFPDATWRMDENTAINTFKNQCQAAKNEGAVVYTILFNFPNPPSTAYDIDTIKAYRDCASDPSFFFPAHDTNGLGVAIREIAQTLIVMRLTK